MTDPRTSWEQVGEELSGLGLKLKLHFEQAAKEGRAEDAAWEALATHADGLLRIVTAALTADLD